MTQRLKATCDNARSTWNLSVCVLLAVLMLGSTTVSCGLADGTSGRIAEAPSDQKKIALPTGYFVEWLKKAQDRCGGWGVCSRRVINDGRGRFHNCTLGPTHVHSAFLTGLALHGVIAGLGYHLRFTQERETDETVSRALECIVANNFTSCNDAEIDAEQVLGVATCTMALCDALFIDRPVTGARIAAEVGVNFLSSSTAQHLPWNKAPAPTRPGLDLCVWASYALCRAKMVGIKFDCTVINRIMAYVNSAVDSGSGITMGTSAGRRVENGSTPLEQYAILVSPFARFYLKSEFNDMDDFRWQYAAMWIKDYFDSAPRSDTMRSELEWLIAGELSTTSPAPGATLLKSMRSGWNERTALVLERVSMHGEAIGVQTWPFPAEAQLNEVTRSVAMLAIIHGIFVRSQ